MRIALVTEFYYPTVGGIQEHVFHFAREARRQGHDVAIITGAIRNLPPSAPEFENGVIRVGRSLRVESNGSVGRVTVGVDLGQRLRKLLTSEHFDIVHVHAPLSPVLPTLAVSNTDLPVVATFHTNFEKSRLMQLLRRPCQAVMDRIDAKVAVSDICVSALKPYVTADFRVIPNGVECAAWGRGRRRYDSNGRRVVLFIGRLEARSGLDRLLRAWPHLPKGLDAELLVLGDGPEREPFELLAQELDVPAQFVGNVHEGRPHYFALADLMVCPTTIASFGITLLEGMAAGLPIIASDIDGFREVMTNGQEGLLLDTAAPQGLAESMANLLESPQLRQQFGEEGRRTAAKYDWSKVAVQILDVYREVGGGV